jgi:amidase
MNPSDYASQDATGLRELVRRKETCARELADVALRVTEALNPRINALVEIWRDEPLASAGAFAGAPFVVKDIGLTTQGRKTEFGSRLALDLRFSADSDLMGRFRRAGFTALGRSAIPEFAMSVATEPLIGGPTRNPWNLSRSAGGSSGGAAAAVAAGLVPVAHATDAGGSIRVPASCTGLVGLKPSRGRVAMGPALDEIWGGLATQFVLTRSVRDSAALLDVLAGANVGDPFEIAPPQRPYASEIGQPSRPLRIGYMEAPPNGGRTAAPVAKSLGEAARLLERLGHHVEGVEMDMGVSWEAFALAVGRYWITYNAAFMAFLAAKTGRAVDLSTVEPTSLAVYRQGMEARAVDLIAAGDVRNQVTRALGRYFINHDLLLTPTLPDLPAPLGQLHGGAEALDGLGWVSRVLDAAPFSSLANMTGSPAISLPLGFDDATCLPIGVQLAAGFGRENLLLRLAADLERAAPWVDRRPLVWAGLVGEERRQGGGDMFQQQAHLAGRAPAGG